MKYSVSLSPEARAHYHGLSAYDRAKVRVAIDDHLQHAPTAESKSRIKRLRGPRKPQYRLRVDDVRVVYDVERADVIVLGIAAKAHVDEWLAEMGKRA
jgi:mRNA-degrading endonuclease RelE of RelBE toxin-antitoxin system